MTYSREERALEDIAKELKQIRKVLERIAQAPIFSKEETDDTKESPQKLHAL